MKVRNFYDFQITQENTQYNININDDDINIEDQDVNIGDYVILHGGSPYWENLYGIIKDIGRFYYSDTDYDNLRLVSFLSELTDQQKFFINSQDRYTKDVISHFKNKKKYDLWAHEEYLVKYDTKEELYKAVKEIEIKNSANKYNL